MQPHGANIAMLMCNLPAEKYDLGLFTESMCKHCYAYEYPSCEDIVVLTYNIYVRI
jgi:hypothetical protein